jgi:branched-chain amino acid aminotransferase
MIEMFGSGTAVSIQPIETIGYNDKIYEVKYDTKLNAGELSH